MRPSMYAYRYCISTTPNLNPPESNLGTHCAHAFLYHLDNANLFTTNEHHASNEVACQPQRTPNLRHMIALAFD